jgi:hypothetical protein
MRRIGIYLRVSTGGQTTENQRLELEAVAARSGWQVVQVYGRSTAKPISSGRSRRSMARPATNKRMPDAKMSAGSWETYAGKEPMFSGDKGGTEQTGDRFRGGYLCSVTDASPGYCKSGSVPSS